MRLFLYVKLSMDLKKSVFLMALNGFLFLLKEISNAENKRKINLQREGYYEKKNVWYSIHYSQY